MSACDALQAYPHSWSEQPFRGLCHPPHVYADAVTHVYANQPGDALRQGSHEPHPSFSYNDPKFDVNPYGPERFQIPAYHNSHPPPDHPSFYGAAPYSLNPMHAERSVPRHRLASTRKTRAHVHAACSNCKHAHLSCDVARPCNRCIQSGKASTCHDVQHKKRGRPRLRDDQSHTRTSVDRGDQIKDGLEQQSNQPRPLAKRPPHGFSSAAHDGADAQSRPDLYLASTASAHFLPSFVMKDAVGDKSPICYMDMDLRIVRKNDLFCRLFPGLADHSDELPLQHLLDEQTSRTIEDLRQSIQCERDAKDPAYLPPLLYGRDWVANVPEIRQSELETLTSSFATRAEIMTFRGQGFFYNGLQVHVSLAKSRVYFVVLALPPTQSSPPTLGVTLTSSRPERLFHSRPSFDSAREAFNVPVPPMPTSVSFPTPSPSLRSAASGYLPSLRSWASSSIASQDASPRESHFARYGGAPCLSTGTSPPSSTSGSRRPSLAPSLGPLYEERDERTSSPPALSTDTSGSSISIATSGSSLSPKTQALALADLDNRHRSMIKKREESSFSSISEASTFADSVDEDLSRVDSGFMSLSPHLKSEAGEVEQRNELAMPNQRRRLDVKDLTN